MNKWLSEDHIEQMTKKPFFIMYPEKVELLKAGKCTECGEEITGFNSELERKEYGISGWCPSCQDKMFNI